MVLYVWASFLCYWDGPSLSPWDPLKHGRGVPGTSFNQNLSGPPLSGFGFVARHSAGKQVQVQVCLSSPFFAKVVVHLHCLLLLFIWSKTKWSSGGREIGDGGGAKIKRSILYLFSL